VAKQDGTKFISLVRTRKYNNTLSYAYINIFYDSSWAFDSLVPKTVIQEYKDNQESSHLLPQPEASVPL